MSSSPAGCDFVTSLLTALKPHDEVSFAHKMSPQTLPYQIIEMRSGSSGSNLSSGHINLKVHKAFLAYPVSSRRYCVVYLLVKSIRRKALWTFRLIWPMLRLDPLDPLLISIV